MGDEQDHIESKRLIYKLQELILHIFAKDAHSADELEFAKHLATYVHQTVLNCVDIGLKNRMLPVAKVDVWCGYLDHDNKEFMYRLAAIGGQPYVELKLQKISELLEAAVVKWADESWGSVIQSVDDDQPTWIIEEDE